jgi:2-oxoisovalerate dehydrogenase E1 component
MGVYWALKAAKSFPGQVEIVDLRTLNPIDTETMYAAVKKHGKCMLVTEESKEASFTLGLAGRIQENCFEALDAPIKIVGSVDTPAIPLNSILEAELLPNADKVEKVLGELMGY